MNRTGAQLNAFGAEALAGTFVGVLDPCVVHGQAVDVQADRLRRFFRRDAGFGRRFASGWRGAGRAGVGRCRQLADVFPIAVAVLVTVQAQVQALDTYVAHLHFTAQQRQYAYRQA
ncbi:hypothetical protein D9M69_415680 [compost metagenome]